MSVALVLVGPEGHVETANAEACRILGVGAHEAAGRPLHDVVTVVPGGAHPVTGVLETGRPTGRVVVEAERRDGRRVRLVGSVAPTANGGDTPRGAAWAFTEDTHATAPAAEEIDPRFREIADCSPALMWLGDKTGACTFFNRTWLDFTGRTMEQELGSGWAEGVHPADRDACMRDYREALASREPFTLYYRLRRADGAYRWLEDRAVPRTGEDGGFHGFAGSCVDITDQRAAQEALAASEARFRQMADAAPFPVWVSDASGAMTFVNRATIEFSGLPEEELLGDAWTQMVHPDDLARLMGEWTGAFDRPLPFTTRWRARRADGEWRLLEDHANPRLDERGRFLGFGGASVDVTDRHAAEEALRASEAHLSSVVAAMAEGIIVLDRDVVIRSANPAAERILGVPPGGLIGVNPTGIEWRAVRADGSPFPPEDIPLMHTLRTGQPLRGELLGMHRHDGTLAWLEINTEPLGAPGQPPDGVVASYMDVTFRLAAEERLRAMVEHLPAGAAFREGERLWVNSTLERITGVPGAGLRTVDDWFRLVWPDDPGAARRAYEARRARGFPGPRVVTIRRPGGEERSLELSGYRDGMSEVWLVIDVTERVRAREELDSSRQAYRRLVDNIPDPVARIGLDGRMLALNAAAARFLGADRDTLTGLSAEEVSRHMSRPNVEAWQAGVAGAAAGEYTELRSVLERADGTPRLFDSRFIPEWNAAGAVESVLVISRDVTDLETAHERSRRRGAILSAVAHVADRLLSEGPEEDVVAEVLGHLGRATAVDRTYVFECVRTSEGRELLYCRHEWCAEGVEPQMDNPDLQPSETEPLGAGWINRHLAGGGHIAGPVRDLDVTPGFREVLRAQAILSLALVPIFVEGDWWGFLGFDDCSTERHWGDEEIEALRAAADVLGAAVARRHSDELLRRWFENTAVGVAIESPDGMLVAVNERLADIVGSTREELVGRHWSEFVHRDDLPLPSEETDRLARGEIDGFEQSARLVRAGGEVRNVRAMAQALRRPDGTVESLVVLLEDVTEAERLTALLHAAAEAGPDAFGVVRALRTPGGDIEDVVLTEINALGAGVLGLTPDQLVGRRVSALGGAFTGYLDEMGRAIATGEVIEREVEVPFPAPRRTGWWRYRLVPVGDAVVATARDVTPERRREAEERALRRVATAIAEGRPAAEAFTLIAEEARLLLEASIGIVVRREEARLPVVGHSPPVQGLPPDGVALPAGGESAAAGAIRTGRPCRVGARQARDPATRRLLDRHAPDVESTAAAPVRVGGAVWGALVVGGTGADAFTREDEERLGRFADMVALAVDAAAARERLEQMARSDPLTGLVNHRAFHERLAEEAARAARHRRNLALIVIDLDDFKQVNDGLGHQAGDDVVREAARRIALCARPGDVVARIGGDEFAWILPETDAVSARTAAERARSALSGRGIGEAGIIRASAGVCDLEQAGGRIGPLVELADGALYWAKATGRDRVVVYSPATVAELSAAERAERLERTRAMAALRALARAVDAKDHATREHSERVAEIAGAVAEQLGWGEDQVALLKEAALLHDVGKIGVPDSILLAPRLLYGAERRQMQVHAVLGAEIVGEVLTAEQASWVRHHHEQWDGRGYPDGLAGTRIPRAARVLALADSWDAMTVARAYGAPLTVEQALAEVERCSGTQFWPAAADAVVELVWRQHPALMAHRPPD